MGEASRVDDVLNLMPISRLAAQPAISQIRSVAWTSAQRIGALFDPDYSHLLDFNLKSFDMDLVHVEIYAK